MQPRRWNRRLVLLGMASAGVSIGVRAQKAYSPGATDTEIRIGQTVPYSGPLSAYSVLGKVEAAYYQKVNDEGGVNGRRITFISLDDAYNPAKTVEAVRRLVEQDEVLFLAGSLGTPTNLAVRRYLHERKVPLLFLSTGGSMWNDPEHFPWTMGFSPTYADEGKIYAQHIVKNHPDARIAVLYQNDDAGKDYVGGFKQGLGDKRAMLVSEASYEVSSPTLDSELQQLKASGANVLFDQTTPKFAAQVIRRLPEIGWKPVHYINNIATSIGSVLKPAGLDNAAGLISTIYLKDTTDPQMADDPAVKEFLTFMKKYLPGGSLVDSTYATGYSQAQAVVQVLRQCGDRLTRENVMRQAENLKEVSLPLLLPGVTLNTSPTNHGPIAAMRMRRFDGQSWVQFGDVFGR